MHLSPLAIVASLLAVAAADCSHDNCLRAIIGNSVPTRSGLADCNSFLQTTVTPATSTYTVTVSSTVTVPVTVTETETDPVTITATSTETTVGYTSTITLTDVQTITWGGVAKRDIEQRQVTAVPSNVPQYGLDACHSDVASYVYACSCVGAAAVTITNPAPVTTVTTTVVGTVTSTATDTAHLTNTITASAVVRVTATAVTTQVVTTTTILDQPVLVAKFFMTGSELAPNNYMQFVSSAGSSLTLVGAQSQASIFVLDQDGLLWTAEGVPLGATPYANGLVGTELKDVRKDSSAIQLSCTIAQPSGQLNCRYGSINTGITFFENPTGQGYVLAVFAGNLVGFGAIQVFANSL